MAVQYTHTHTHTVVTSSHPTVLNGCPGKLHAQKSPVIETKIAAGQNVHKKLLQVKDKLLVMNMYV